MFKKVLATCIVSFAVSAFAIAAEVPVDAKLDYNAGKLYNLLLPSQRFLNPEYDNHPVYVKNSSI